MGLVQLVRGYKGWFSKPAVERVRVIVEGSKDNDWMNHHMDIDVYDIPQDTTTLQIGYTLDLAAKINADGELEGVTDRPAQVLLTPGYDYANRIQRVTSVITEDGRVFYDFGFKHSDDPHPPDDVASRLHHLLRGLLKRYDSFAQTYAEIEANKNAPD